MFCSSRCADGVREIGRSGRGDGNRDRAVVCMSNQELPCSRDPLQSVLAASFERDARPDRSVVRGPRNEYLPGAGKIADALLSARPTTSSGRTSTSQMWTPARTSSSMSFALLTISFAARTARVVASKVARNPSLVFADADQAFCARPLGEARRRCAIGRRPRRQSETGPARTRGPGTRRTKPRGRRGVTHAVEEPAAS
jgi:hypothetical protein